MSHLVKEIHSTLLDDSYYRIDHPSGLTILVMPKAGYSSAYALFGTKYGSIDTRFKRSDEADFTEVPEGIAHFLEHKLFESEDLDAFARYAKTGASANAYTSFERTCYLFSCAGNFKASLEILLDFVQSPYFTEQTVQKEQGIIGQEIRMYQDEPNWQVMFNCLRALYKVHPVRIDIAGTIDSISHITADLLYRCYRTFYNLHNMALAVAGNVTVNEVLEVADRLLKPADALSIERNFPDEPAKPCSPLSSKRLMWARRFSCLALRKPMRRRSAPCANSFKRMFCLKCWREIPPRFIAGCLTRGSSTRSSARSISTATAMRAFCSPVSRRTHRRSRRRSMRKLSGRAAKGWTRRRLNARAASSMGAL